MTENKGEEKFHIIADPNKETVFEPKIVIPKNVGEEIDEFTPFDGVISEIDEKIEKNKHYVKAKDFRTEYYLSIDKNEPTVNLLKMFEKIGKGWGKKFPNTNPQDLDTYIGFAVSEAWRKWKRYNPDVSDNLFAFFTSMIKNDMALAHNKLHKNKHLHVSIDGLYVNQSQL